jgi:hypothetical protein
MLLLQVSLYLFYPIINDSNLCIDPQNVGKYVLEMKVKLDSIASKITEYEKEIYSSIAKYGKSLDKVSSSYNHTNFC